MSEEETKQGTEEEGKKDTVNPNDDGAKYETTPVIERAREEREKLEAANTKREELLDREEAMMAKRELGGRAEAGGQPAEKKETDSEKSKRYIKENFENLR
ncbi:hypothetical protein LCGC14_1155790 [marine sediment metagenome]|uniref:Uncharacterized protein n=1 Tax=marine sediment metagenome TaxID=412755 RepID=A0A0F9LYY9_9ZZZZ